jgi:hypothetical protein
MPTSCTRNPSHRRSYTRIGELSLPDLFLGFQQTLIPIALGLRLRFESPGWSEFETGVTTLALHVAMPAAAKPQPQCAPIAGTCAIGFTVTYLNSAYLD